MNGHRIVAGNPPLRRGALTEQAIKARDLAVQLGFNEVALLASRVARSPSRYLHFRDARSILWRIRFSDHYCPGHIQQPDLDVVIYDGDSGFVEVAAFLRAVAAGHIEQRPRAPRGKRR